MKKLLMILTALLFGAFRGLYEGMIMAMTGDAMHSGLFEGVRGHVGFEYYHVFGFFAPILAAVFALELFLWRPRDRDMAPGWLLFVLGCLLLIWEAFELAYGYSRHGTVLAAYEHIVVLDIVSIYLRGWMVYGLHAVRTAAGITFITKGGNK